MITAVLRLPGPLWGFLFLCAMLAAGLPRPGLAADCLSGPEARKVVASGDVIPFGRIAGRMRKRGMDVMDVRLCRRGGRFVYELTVVSRTGSVRKMTVDAHSGGGYGR